MRRSVANIMTIALHLFKIYKGKIVVSVVVFTDMVQIWRLTVIIGKSFSLQ